MNKTQLIDMAAAKSGLTKKDTTAALESIIDSIQETLAKGEQVALIGFGTFSVKARNARTAKVPGTDKTVDVPATTVAKFNVGKALKDAVAKSLGFIVDTILKNMSHDDLIHLIGSYNNYIQDFDYVNSGTPVSIYEFFEYEYQEISGETN